MKRPNVLIILSDQQRYDTVSCAGNPHMHTPNLDKLASEGQLFCNAHSSNPVCMPARHDLITGFPGRVHGFFGNGNRPMKDYSVPTIARVFAENDYRTVAVGKMHFFPAREHHGFDQMIAMEELPKIRQEDEYVMYLKEQGLGEIQNPHGVRPHIYHVPQTSQQPDENHGTTWVADSAIDWLNKNEGNPFFMMCGFIQPHPPWNIPEKWQDLYKDVKIPEPIQEARPPFEDSSRPNWYGDTDTPEQKEKIRKAYFTAVSMVDYHTGRIIEHLRETGELDNTLIIYTSDHGEMLQDKGYYSKELPYDSSVRIPFIVRYPNGFEQGITRDEFVELMDIFPTCLDVCGIDYNGTRDLYGKSIVEPKNRDYQFASFGTGSYRWIMCKNKDYKYIYHFCGGYEEIYETNKPEIKNLIADGVSDELKAVYEELRQQAIAYEEEWGVEGYVENHEFVAKENEPFHATVRGKFHKWSNVQMQVYQEKCYNRGEILEKEMKHAMSNEDFSGVKLEDVMNDEEWKEHFAECFDTFTNGAEFNNFPFKK